MNATTPDQTEKFDATELGAMMREMRENLGHDLEKVALDLRIRLVYLEAIEAGRLSDLPGNAYVSGFLRAYSDYLGLDGEEIVRRFKMAGAEISGKTQLHLPSPVEEGRLPTAFILLVAAVIAAGAYGGWYYVSSQGGDPMETVAKLPRELSGLVEGAANQTAPAPARAQSEAAPAATPDPSSPMQTETSETAPVVAPAESQSEAQSEPQSESRSGTLAAAGSDAPSAPAAPDQTVSSEGESGSDIPPAAARTPVVEPGTAAAPPAETSPVPAADSAPAQAAAVPATPPADEPAASPVDTPANEPAVSGTAETPAAESAAAPPAAVEDPARETAPPPEPETRAVETTPAPEASVAPTPEPAPEAPSQTASAPQDTEPASSRILAGSSTDTVRIVVRATADSYVAVRTADNEALFSQLMRPGDSYEVPSGANLLLETGNAGGLQITVGGKRVPSLGPSGEIRRNIPLDAEKLLNGLN